ncbi:uncharacterized protein LACBIDRAFT_297962 [Laccaria bicolor S238N-H82]|uniref:Predicted protein n=1 Tax=Laccaria bicolor (strain S238N-H82 / ATCC MYA-4686) TaxID=486041 RepID=B0DBY1_LACBS|nr:uncharacterized protein LACBIDRAFT_297962 [Laccaria bicolor S238N-H82]EDR07796.1 predicted protein [Laccaria bicolor S238N-H82]|eukprot:XP_001881585.1 predicted protein [Laccaria bicolor S238N-H82]
MANLADVFNSVGRIIISCWAFLISLIGFGAEFQNLITYIDHIDGHPRRDAATPDNDTPPDDATPNSNTPPNDAAPNSNTPPASSPPNDDVLFNATLWQTFTSAMQKSHKNLRLVAFLQLPIGGALTFMNYDADHYQLFRVLGFISLGFACPALFASHLFLSKFGVIDQHTNNRLGNIEVYTPSLRCPPVDVPC